MQCKDFTVKGWENLIRKFWKDLFSKITDLNPNQYKLSEILDCEEDENGKDVYFIYTEELSEKEIANAFGFKASDVKRFFYKFSEEDGYDIVDWELLENNYKKAWCNIYNENWGGVYTKEIKNNEIIEAINKHYINFNDYNKIIIEKTKGELKIICK